MFIAKEFIEALIEDGVVKKEDLEHNCLGLILEGQEKPPAPPAEEEEP